MGMVLAVVRQGRNVGCNFMKTLQNILLGLLHLDTFRLFDGIQKQKATLFTMNIGTKEVDSIKKKLMPTRRHLIF